MHAYHTATDRNVRVSTYLIKREVRKYFQRIEHQIKISTHLDLHLFKLISVLVGLFALWKR